MVAGSGIALTTDNTAKSITIYSDSAQTVTTWVPTIVLSGGGGGTVTYSTRLGTYIKSGQSITCYFSIIITNVAGGSGTVRISGLPFGSYVAAGATVGSASLNNYTFSSMPSGVTGVVNSGAAYADLYWHEPGGAHAVSLMTAANLGTSATLIGSITYITV